MARAQLPHERAGTAQKVTLVMVAHRAGVSPQTVSNAINSPNLLRPDTLQRVRRAIDALGYRPHRAAQSLRTRSSKLIGYAIKPVPPDTSNPVMDGFLHALSQTADDSGHRILLFAAPDGPTELDAYQELLDTYSVDGFVLSGTTHGDPRQPWLAKRSVPFAAFGRMWSGRQVGDWVDVDGAAGTAAAVEHLVTQGHKKIAFLGWPRGSGAGDDRATGWKRAMQRHGLPVRGRHAETFDDVELSRVAAGPLLDAGATAVVAASDTLAVGCYRALADRGLTPGEDVVVTGFDDTPAARLLTPPLTSVTQPLGAAGRECVRLLLARIADPDREPERLLLAPELVVRASSTAWTRA
ncbi:LacI family DNA-binding transcriptional regulator [Streptomyces sp. NPDC046900]|uniref:LacI family DNA-binding transcriptional regulator n=1 Tax=Streptomyces sp. NPDC046900 TaxID=3155473 RepID=UPI0033C28CBB